jgi:hypothetical protein
MAIDLSERQKEIATGLTIIGLVFGGLLAGEVALRVVNMMKFGTVAAVEEAKTYRTDPETGLRVPVPGSNHGQATINSLGFRGPEIPAEKPPETLRLAFLGSSTTFDPYVGESGNWPHLVARHLDKAVSGCSVDYANAGVAGYSTPAMEKHFAANVAPLDPDVVIIMPSDLNALLDDHAKRVIDGFDGTHYEPGWLARNFTLWAKVEKNLTIIRRQRAAFSEAGKLDADWDEVMAPAAEAVRSIISTVRETNAVPVIARPAGRLRASQPPEEQVESASTALFYMPFMSVPGLIEAGQAFGNALKRASARADAPYIGDRDAIPPTEQYYVDSSHTTPAGSRLQAQRILDGLLAAADVRRRIEAVCGSAPRAVKASGT